MHCYLPSSVIRRREDGDEWIGALVVKAVPLRLRAAGLRSSLVARQPGSPFETRNPLHEKLQ